MGDSIDNLRSYNQDSLTKKRKKSSEDEVKTNIKYTSGSSNKSELSSGTKLDSKEVKARFAQFNNQRPSQEQSVHNISTLGSFDGTYSGTALFGHFKGLAGNNSNKAYAMYAKAMKDYNGVPSDVRALAILSGQPPEYFQSGSKLYNSSEARLVRYNAERGYERYQLSINGQYSFEHMLKDVNRDLRAYARRNGLPQPSTEQMKFAYNYARYKSGLEPYVIHNGMIAGNLAYDTYMHDMGKMLYGKDYMKGVRINHIVSDSGNNDFNGAFEDTLPGAKQALAAAWNPSSTNVVYVTNQGISNVMNKMVGDIYNPPPGYKGSYRQWLLDTTNGNINALNFENNPNAALANVAELSRRGYRNASVSAATHLGHGSPNFTSLGSEGLYVGGNAEIWGNFLGYGIDPNVRAFKYTCDSCSNADGGSYASLTATIGRSIANTAPKGTRVLSDGAGVIDYMYKGYQHYQDSTESMAGMLLPDNPGLDNPYTFAASGQNPTTLAQMQNSPYTTNKYGALTFNTNHYTKNLTWTNNTNSRHIKYVS